MAYVEVIVNYEMIRNLTLNHIKQLDIDFFRIVNRPQNVIN